MKLLIDCIKFNVLINLSPFLVKSSKILLGLHLDVNGFRYDLINLRICCGRGLCFLRFHSKYCPIQSPLTTSMGYGGPYITSKPKELQIQPRKDFIVRIYIKNWSDNQVLLCKAKQLSVNTVALLIPWSDFLTISS